MTMNRLTSVAQRWLASHHGVITTRQLAASGMSPRAIAQLVADGVLTRLTRGVYLLSGTPSTLEQRAAILCATYPAGFVTGATAGMLMGLRRMPRTASLQFSVHHGVNPEPEAGVRFRQTTKLIPSDRTTRPDGIIVASGARLAFDLAADLNRLDHISAVNQLLDRRDVTADQLRAIGARLVHPGRRGSRRFAHTLAALSSNGGAAQDSDAEVRLLDALRDRGVPVEPQVPVATRLGVLHLDLGVPAARWGVEVDVHPEHRSLEGQRNDADRRSAMNAADWHVESVTELHLEEMATTADHLASEYRRRAMCTVNTRRAADTRVS
jgi:hypothetical protein